MPHPWRWPLPPASWEDSDEGGRTGPSTFIRPMFVRRFKFLLSNDKLVIEALVMIVCRQRTGYRVPDLDCLIVRCWRQQLRDWVRKSIRLRCWYMGTYAEIALNKLGDMDKNGFEDIMAEFAPKFEWLKPLARELWKVLFPIRDGAIFTGTFRDHKIM